jgi:hypothetical protein
VDLKASQHFTGLGVKIDTLVKSIKGIPVFLTLDGKQYKEYEEWHISLSAKYPNVNFGGASSFAYSATFSDQVVQGIMFSGKVSKNVQK